MHFSWLAFAIVVLLVLVSGMCAYADEQFFSQSEGLRRKSLRKFGPITMGFINHGGMWGDLLLMSVVVGMVTPYVWDEHRTLRLILALLALGITILAHVLWAQYFRTAGITGHMWPDHIFRSWWLDMSTSGYLHVAIMTWFLTTIFLYIAYPVSSATVWWVSGLLTVHVFLGTVQPGWYCTRKLWTWGNFAPPLVCTALIWVVAAVKLH